jgi:hypothetical protein
MPLNDDGFWGLQHEMPILHLSVRSTLHFADRGLGAGPFGAALRLDAGRIPPPPKAAIGSI